MKNLSFEFKESESVSSPSSPSSPLSLPPPRELSALPATTISSFVQFVHSYSFSASEDAIVTISTGTSSGCPLGA